MKLMLLLTVCSALPLLIGGIAISGKKCGTKVCSISDYCSKFNNQCEKCDIICDRDSHNFDLNVCSEDCQDYLHESRYITVSSYTADFRSLQNQQTVTMIILLMLLILFVGVHGCHCIRWMRRKNYFSFEFITFLTKKRKEKQEPAPQSVFAPEKPPKVNYSIYSVSGKEETVTAPVSRYPAEDTLFSYDNAALQVPPNCENTKPETNF